MYVMCEQSKKQTAASVGAKNPAPKAAVVSKKPKEDDGGETLGSFIVCRYIFVCVCVFCQCIMTMLKHICQGAPHIFDGQHWVNNSMAIICNSDKNMERTSYFSFS